MTGSLSPSFSQIIHSGLQEIIGNKDIYTALQVTDKHLFKPDHPLESAKWSGFYQAMEQVLGMRGSHGAMLRVGRASFLHLLKKYGADGGLIGTEFQMLPLQDRLSTGLVILAGIINREGNQSISLEKLDDGWLWRMANCPDCHNRHKETEPVCYFWVGMLQECLAWISGGKYYPVSEVECRACGGSACVFHIQQKPLD